MNKCESLFDFCMDMCNKKMVNVNGYLPNDKYHVTMPVRKMIPIYKSLDCNYELCRDEWKNIIRHSKNWINYKKACEVLSNMANNDKIMQNLYKRRILPSDIENKFYIKLMVDWTISGILAEEALMELIEEKGLTVFEVDENKDWKYHVDLVVVRYESFDKAHRTGIQVKGTRYLNTHSWEEVKQMNESGMKKFIADGYADKCMFMFYDHYLNPKKSGVKAHEYKFWYYNDLGEKVYFK